MKSQNNNILKQRTLRTLTNRNNLPQTLVDAISDDQHWLGGDISVTTLIDAPQVRMLKRNNEVEEDVMDMMWATLGTGVHAILERAQVPSVKRRAFNEVIEAIQVFDKAMPGNDKLKTTLSNLQDLKETLYPEQEDQYLFEHRMVTLIDGWKVSGTMDLYDKVNNKIWDYKVCSTYNYMNPEGHKKWHRQLNIYAYKLRKQGYVVKDISVVAIFRDWSGARLERDSRYPPAMTMEIALPVFSDEVVEKYIKERIAIHKRAQAGEQIDCDGTERWAEATTYAAMKPSRKTAIKLLGDNEHTANTWIAENKHLHLGIYLEKRPGSFGRRCMEYCPVNTFCPQFKRMSEENQ